MPAHFFNYIDVFFKKKKIKKKSSSFFLTLVTLISAGAIFLLGVFVVSAMGNFNFQITGSGWLLGNAGSLIGKKDPIEYILLTGRGGGNHDAPNLTDTIILVGVNDEQEAISMLSLPRDLYVSYDDLYQKSGRINGIYDLALTRGKTQDEAMQALASKVGEITGKTVTQYVNIDFQGFEEVVDTLWWVEVTLEENFIDTAYPTINWGYTTFMLKKWTWTLDGETALKYARSRHSTSDFDRSLRQQQIISSLQNKVSNLGYFSDSGKILELYNLFREYVDTNMSSAQMIKLWLKIKKWENSVNLSYNLNDGCYTGIVICPSGGLLYLPERAYFGGASVILPLWADASNISHYDTIHTFADIIFDQPRALKPEKMIAVYNAGMERGSAGELVKELSPFGFIFDPSSLSSMLNTLETYSGSIMYYNGIESDDPILGVLDELIDIPYTMEKVEFPKYSSGDVRIELILSPELSETL